jgi:hypothetical protein
VRASFSIYVSTTDDGVTSAAVNLLFMRGL